MLTIVPESRLATRKYGLDHCLKEAKYKRSHTFSPLASHRLVEEDPLVRAVGLHEVATVLSNAKLVQVAKDVVVHVANTPLRGLAKAAFRSVQTKLLQPISSHDHAQYMVSVFRMNVCQLLRCSKRRHGIHQVVQVFVTLDDDSGKAADLNTNHQPELSKIKRPIASVVPILYTLFEPLLDVHVVEFLLVSNVVVDPVQDTDNTVDESLDSILAFFPTKGIQNDNVAWTNAANMRIPKGVSEILNGKAAILKQWVIALQQLCLV